MGCRAVEPAVIQCAAEMTVCVRVRPKTFAALKSDCDTTELMGLTRAIATDKMVALLVVLETSPEV